MMMAQPGIGLGRPAGRPVMPPMAAPVGLSGPVAGVGGPDPRMMRPPVPGMFPPGMQPYRGLHLHQRISVFGFSAIRIPKYDWC